MSTTSLQDGTIRSPELRQARNARHRLGAADLLLVSVWAGLAAGLAEVAARVICRAIDPSQRIYMMSRHFLWLGPLSNLAVLPGVGSGLVGGCQAVSARGGMARHAPDLCVCSIPRTHCGGPSDLR